MKKLIVYLCALLTFLSLAMTVAAAKSVSLTLSLSDSSVGVGDKVTVTVKAAVDQCGNGGIEVSYDTKRFELISGEWLINGILTDFNEKSKDGVFALASDEKLSGKIFKLVLKVKSDAPIGNGDVTVKFKADDVTASKSISVKVACSHKYSNNCDTTCDKCGDTRKITHKWNSGEVIKKATCTDAGSTKYTCTVCKETKTEKIAKRSHTFDHDCDTECNVCGATRKITHNYAWTCDSLYHWLECSVCGTAQEKASHSLMTDITSNQDGHGHLCDVCNLIPDIETHDFSSACDADCGKCGYVRTVTHRHDEQWTADAQAHWYVCSLCGEVLNKESHIPGEAATQTTDQICTVCDHILVPADNHQHTLHGEWLTNEDAHWYQCRCGEFSMPEAHIWGEGTIDEEAGVILYSCIDCNKVMAEIYVPETEPPVETAPEPERPAFMEQISFMEEIEILDGVPLWAVFVAGVCVSVIINFVLIISAIAKAVRKSRFKGKYE